MHAASAKKHLDLPDALQHDAIRRRHFCRAAAHAAASTMRLLRHAQRRHRRSTWERQPRAGPQPHDMRVRHYVALLQHRAADAAHACVQQQRFMLLLSHTT